MYTAIWTGRRRRASLAVMARHIAYAAWVAPAGVIASLSDVGAALVWITAAPILHSVAVVVSAHVLRLMPQEAENRSTHRRA